jgi:uncharacterized protein (TIGR02246 family)
MNETTLTQQDVERLNHEFEAAFNGGDMAALASLYAEDARVMPPGGEIVRGRQAIQQFWQAAREQMGIRSVRLDTQDVESSSDLGREIGSATLEIQPSDGLSTSLTVKYLVVWKRSANGDWQLAVDMWNTNA